MLHTNPHVELTPKDLRAIEIARTNIIGIIWPKILMIIIY